METTKTNRILHRRECKTGLSNPRWESTRVQRPRPCKILVPTFNIQNVPAKVKNVNIAGNVAMFWRQYWWRRLSLVPNVFRAWHVYWRWNGLNNARTNVRRQEILAPSRDRISLNFPGKIQIYSCIPIKLYRSEPEHLRQLSVPLLSELLTFPFALLPWFQWNYKLRIMT